MGVEEEVVARKDGVGKQGKGKKLLLNLAKGKWGKGVRRVKVAKAIKEKGRCEKKEKGNRIGR